MNEADSKGKINIYAILGAAVLFCIAAYFALGIYYKQSFLLNTWINGVYCTGRTPEDVSEELSRNADAPVINIVDIKGESISFNLSDYDYSADYLTAVKRYITGQKPFLWLLSVSSKTEHKLTPLSEYDRDKLLSDFENSDMVKNALEYKGKCILERDENEGYYIIDGYSNILDVDKAKQIIADAVFAGETEIDLSQKDCYYSLPEGSEAAGIKELFKKVDAVQSSDIRIDMGVEKFSLSKGEIAEMLRHAGDMPFINADGNFEADADAVRKYTDHICELYNTYGIDRKFLSSKGDYVTVPAGTYGTEIDGDELFAWLFDNLLDEKGRTLGISYTPIYKHEGYVRGIDDTGGTYIEVDMSNQHLYYYEEGRLILDTDIVTGGYPNGSDTPAGCFYAYDKQTDRVLVGPGYRTPVKFWIRVKDSIGIHDADWREEFGGEIYKTDGSHGCVNVPVDIMSKLYDLTKEGTPIIMYYR